jgi:hypothetical protein
MTWRGVFSGALALIALEALLRSDQSVERFGGLLEGAGELVRKALSPEVPAIPNLRARGYKGKTWTKEDLENYQEQQKG